MLREGNGLSAPQPTQRHSLPSWCYWLGFFATPFLAVGAVTLAIYAVNGKEAVLKFTDMDSAPAYQPR